jgi:hypothetical protein
MISQEHLEIVLSASGSSGLMGTSLTSYGRERSALLQKGPKIPVPWNGVATPHHCSALRMNHGLFTQCTNECSPDGEKQERNVLCKTCSKTGAPLYGTVSDRLQTPAGELYTVEVNGKERKEVDYARVIKKLKLDVGLVMATAAVQGWSVPDGLRPEIAKPKNHAIVTSDEEAATIQGFDHADSILSRAEVKKTNTEFDDIFGDSVLSAPKVFGAAGAQEEKSVQFASVFVADEPAAEPVVPVTQSQPSEENSTDLIGALVEQAANAAPTRNDINKATAGALKEWCGSYAVKAGTKQEMQNGLREKLGYTKRSAKQTDEERAEKKAAKEQVAEAKKQEKAEAAEAKKQEKAEAAEVRKKAKAEAAEVKREEKAAAAQEKKHPPLAVAVSTIPIATELIAEPPVVASTAEEEITQAREWKDESTGADYLKDDDGYLFGVEHPHPQVGMYYQGRVWTDAELDDLEANREATAIASESPADE